MAIDDDASKARANTSFRAQSDRHEKGSAMGLIAEEAKATENKTARLRRLREERDAANPPAEAKPVRKRAKTAAAGRSV